MEGHELEGATVEIIDNVGGHGWRVGTVVRISFYAENRNCYGAYTFGTDAPIHNEDVVNRSDCWWIEDCEFEVLEIEGQSIYDEEDYKNWKDA